MAADFHSQVRSFYEANRQALFTYAVSLAGDRAVAEDAVQGAMLGLLRRGRLPANPRPYAFRSVRNAVVDGFRTPGAVVGRGAGLRCLHRPGFRHVPRPPNRQNQRDRRNHP